jgi:hypothetical protein
MLTLLLKRQARARKELAKKELATEEHKDVVSEKVNTPRTAFEKKPWNEIQHSLKMDLEYARTMAGSTEKVPFKGALIKKYKPVITNLLSTHDNLDGLDVIWWFYQWQIDCGLLDTIHDEFKALVLKGLNSPQGWRSNGQTAYLDIIFKYSDGAKKANTKFNAQYLSDAVTDLLSGTLATNAPLKVKMFRLMGDLFYEADKKEEALALFEAVMAIDPEKGGRKTKVKDLKEELGYE